MTFNPTGSQVSAVTHTQASREECLDQQLPAPPRYEAFQPVSQATEGQGVLQWRCPVCGLIKKGDKIALSQMRRYHCKTRRPETPFNIFLVKPRNVPPVVPSNLIPREQRAWQCPCCDVGLPQLTSIKETHKAVSAHRKLVHPRISMQKWRQMLRTTALKGVPKKSPRIAEAAKKTAAKKRQKNLKGHVVFDFAADPEKTTRWGEKSQWWCANCLQLLGEHGHSKRNLVPGCKTARKQKGTPVRIRRAWKVLKQRPEAVELRKKALENAWIRDLVEDGDVESQPGPSALDLMTDGLDSSPPMKIMTFNSGGAKGAWSSLSLLLAEKPQIVLLQETAFDEAEAAGFAAQAKKEGFHAFFAGAQTSGPHGGAMMLVQETLRSRPAWKFNEIGGAAQAVWVNGTLCFSAYLAPRPDARRVADEIASVILSLPCNHQWLIGGDFNVLPENPMTETLTEVGGTITAPVEPARWEGKRIIDYLFANGEVHQALNLDLRLSDHKVVVASWSTGGQVSDQYVVQKAPTLPCVQLEKQQAWTLALSTAWQAEEIRCESKITEHTTLDEEWQHLSQAFFCALQQAHENIGNPLHKMQRKDCKPVEVKICKKDRIYRHAAGNFTSARQKVLARLLARLYELRKRRCETHPSDFSNIQMNHLWTKISRSPHFDHEKNLTANILDLTKRYNECCDQENQTRLNRWRTRMQADSAAFAWLRRKIQPMTHAVRLQVDDTASETVQEALENLATFWKNIWNRQTPDPAAIWPTMRDHMQPPETPESWPPLQAKDLRTAAKVPPWGNLQA